MNDIRYTLSIALTQTTPHPVPLPQGARELSLYSWAGFMEVDIFS